MKTMIISSTCVSAFLFALVIQSVINGKTAYVQELEDALSTAVSQTVKEVMEQDSYGIENRNEFIAAFLQALVVRTNSDVDMTVRVIRADPAAGVLDIEVREAVRILSVYEKELVVRRKVVFEKGNRIPA